MIVDGHTQIRLHRDQGAWLPQANQAMGEAVRQALIRRQGRYR